jgi:hypothetical protein
MPLRLSFLAALTLTAICNFVASRAEPQARSDQACIPIHVALDTTFADTVLVANDSRGYGQVISVADTLVSSITFWRPAQPDTFPEPAVLYVTSVDSTGRPNVLDVLYASPIVGGPYGDGIHAIPLTFTFDPPLALPKAGSYYFDVNEENPPDPCIGVVRLLGDTRNDYVYGGAWKTGISDCNGQGPGGPFPNNPRLDMVFEITLCDTNTPTRLRTWGELKARYH